MRPIGFHTEALGFAAVAGGERTSRPLAEKNQRGSSTPPPTFVVEESLHFHGRPGVCDAEHGAGHDALLGRGAVGGAHQAPVGLVVEPLQDLHSLAPPHRQLPAAAVGGHEVVAHHRQLAAAGQLRRKREKN